MPQPAKFSVNKEMIARVFFFSTFVFLLYQLFLLARPFLSALLVATMLAIMFYPLYRRVRRTVKNANVAALVLTASVLLAAVLPLMGIGSLVMRESGRLIPTVQGTLETVNTGDPVIWKEQLPDALARRLERVSESLKQLNVNMEAIVMENVRELGGKIAGLGGLIARNAFFSIVKLVIMVMALFFTFRDGETFLNWVVNLVPMEAGHKYALAKTAYETFWAVTTGVFLTAAAQGFVAMLGFLIAGIRLPVLLGLATGFVSLLGASFVVTWPVALFVMSTEPKKGLFLLFWGAVVVGFLDNLLKPLLIGSRARMPFILVFFSIIGGLKMYGLLGLVLGPLLVASVLTFIRIYREAYSA